MEHLATEKQTQYTSSLKRMQIQYVCDHTQYRSYMRKFSKKEVERLFLLGLLEGENNPELVSPSFAQSKPKSNQVRFISDFRNFNKKLRQKPFLIPNINEILLKL